MLQHQYEPVYFRHDLIAGDTLYILLDARGDLQHLIHGVDKGLQEEANRCLCVERHCNSEQ